MRTFRVNEWALMAAARLFPRWFGRKSRPVVLRPRKARPPVRPIMEICESREAPTAIDGLASALVGPSRPSEILPALVQSVQTAPEPALDFWAVSPHDIVGRSAVTGFSVGREQSSGSAGYSAERDEADSALSESTKALPWNSQASLFAANFETLLNPDALFADPLGPASPRGGAGVHSNGWQPGEQLHPTSGESGGTSGGGSSLNGGGNEQPSSDGGQNGADRPFRTSAAASGLATSGLGNANAGLPSPLLSPLSQPASPMGSPPFPGVRPQSSPQPTGPQGSPTGPGGPLLLTGPGPDMIPDLVCNDS
jgi:hypothetical protein